MKYFRKPLYTVCDEPWSMWRYNEGTREDTYVCAKAWVKLRVELGQFIVRVGSVRIRVASAAASGCTTFTLRSRNRHLHTRSHSSSWMPRSVNIHPPLPSRNLSFLRLPFSRSSSYVESKFYYRFGPRTTRKDNCWEGGSFPLLNSVERIGSCAAF